jgi:hypothetical protein
MQKQCETTRKQCDNKAKAMRKQRESECNTSEKSSRDYAKRNAKNAIKEQREINTTRK